MSGPAALAGFAALVAVLALRDLLGGGGPRGALTGRGSLTGRVRFRGSRVAHGLAALVDVVVTLGREGRDPGAAERRRLLLAGAALALISGWLVAGPVAGLALGCGGPWLVARLLRARRERFRRAVDAGVPALALAVADALSGGHSLHGALAEATRSVSGAAGHELRRVQAELAIGAGTEEALEAMRARVRSPRLDVVVAACVLQRNAGGDLARLLREGARAMEEQSQLEGELRAATAQARFTGVLVAGLPLGGAALAELASPGWIAGLWGSFLTAWLVGISLALQLLAAFLIRRLGRVRW
jgi:tight adherence protein B